MGSQAQYVKQPSVTDRLKSGGKTVTTAGTRVQLSTSSVNCIDLIVQAKRSNTGRIYIGGSDVANDDAHGIYLTAGQSISLNITNLNQVYLDSSVSGEGVAYTYTETQG